MKKIKMLQRLAFLSFALMLVIVLGSEFPSANAEVQDVVDTKLQQDVVVYQGDLVALKVYSLTRIAIGNPGIVDISNADVNEVLLIGRAIGETPVFIWDENGKRKLMVRVLQEDLDLIMARIKKLLESAQIDGITLQKNGYEGKVVVTGKVLKDQKKQVEDILKSFDAYVINLAREEIDLIQIDAQISELNTTLDKTLGIDWAAQAEDAFRLKYVESDPGTDGSLGDLFKIGDFNRVTAINATVNALITEGKGRILSKPSILVSNGEEANLLVGGEIPIRTTTTSTGTGAELTENIAFKEYGITLNVKPEIIDDKINMSLIVETRDIDAANAIANTAAFITRSAKTKLSLNDGQTIVLAGLIKHSQSERVKRLPFLSDIPIVGALFRIKLTPTPNQDIELVVSLTPRIVKQQKYIDEQAVREQQEKEKKNLEETDESSSASLFPEASSDEGRKENASGPGTEVTESSATEGSSIGTSSVEKSSTTQESVGASIVKSPAEATTAETPSPSPAVSLPSSETPKQEVKSSEIETKTTTTSSSDKVITSVPLPEPSAEEKVAMLKDATPTSDEQDSKAIMDYVQKVQKKISQSISFPYEAKEKGWQGTVKLSLTILSNGDLNQAAVKQSSGHDIFDKDAVNTAQIVAPFDTFPTEIKQQELTVTIPIVYNQDSAL